MGVMARCCHRSPRPTLPAPWRATTRGSRAAIEPLATRQRGRALATLRDVNMIKLESGNPPLQLGKAVCNSADYPLIKQYAASFLMLQRGAEQRETRCSMVPLLPPVNPGDQRLRDGQNSYFCVPSPAGQTGQATTPLHPGTVQPGTPQPGAGLAKWGVLQEQQVLRWHLARKSTPTCAPALLRHPGAPAQAHPVLVSQRRGTHWHRAAELGLWHDLQAPPFWVFYCTVSRDY